MPTETIDNTMVTQFSDMVHVKAQQKMSRLRPYVRMGKMTGDIWAYDGIGDVEARELTGRFNETQFDDIEHNRRKLSRRRFSVTLPIDAYDVAGRLNDPKGQYAEACVAAMERKLDKVIIDAMFADVYTGRDMTTVVTAASDGVLTVNATAGLTQAKLLEALQNFIDNEVGVDAPTKKVMGISGDEHTAILGISTITSGDYSRQYALEKGEIQNALGIDLIKYGASARTPMLPVSGGVRTSFIMSEGAMFVGMSQDFEITVDKRSDYVQTTQVQIVGTFGAVRTEGKRIQKFTTTD